MVQGGYTANMDNYENSTIENVGIPYDDINWYDIDGQPFGSASDFNLFVFGDANNLIEVEGAMAVGGSFFSPRGISVGFGRKGSPIGIGYSSDLARFIVGGNVAMSGPLVVTGHAVVGGGFRAAKGSTYLIGDDGTEDQMEELKYLYQAEGGSEYWTPSDKGDHFIVPSYDVPRVTRASRIDANLPLFFQNARESIEDYKACIESLEVNGTVTDNFHEWVLRGNDPIQNVFLLDVSPNGLLNKGIRAEVPEGSIIIVRLRTGRHAHLQYGLYGEERQANYILYVFEDATDIHMEVSADIWGSILAPQATFHAHPTGGHVSGTAAIGTFAVNAYSGFEFHLYPFVGGIVCQAEELIPSQPPTPAPIPRPVPPPAQAPILMPCPEPEPCPPCPEPRPCPPCPERQPCPECPPCPEPRPCPPCPEPRPCPPCPEPRPCPPCPEPRPCPPCPEPQPCPECPSCPEPRPCPSCPECPPCPVCPVCPERKTEYIAVPIPVPVPIKQKVIVCPECAPCPECLIAPGIILGCVCGCKCCETHEWDVMLYRIEKESKILMYCVQICSYGYFEFVVPHDGYYLLKICPSKKNRCFRLCKPKLTLKNVGVTNLTVE